MSKTVAFCTLGCKVNQYETDAMCEMFSAAGYEIVDFNRAADIYVVNTCTVTNMADRKSRQMLHRAKKKNPESIVVAVGCYVQAAKEQLSEDPMIDLIVGNNKKKDIVAIVEDFISEQGEKLTSVLDIAHEQAYETLSISRVSEHTRAYIKIQDGCNQFCSYCIIPYARGRVRSRSSEDILAEVKNLVANGYKEIVLTGIHISSYGLDFDHAQETEGEEDYDSFKTGVLISLIEEISHVPGLLRIRLGSLEPRIITEAFLERLSKIPQICPHFHLSLQSGCDATLQRMNRHYTTALYKEKCQLLRKYFDRPALTTDVIVGFPGETDEEFAETEKFLKDIAFYQMHIFKYSRRAGTRADRMPNQIDPSVMNLRSDRLLALSERMNRDYLELCKDQIQDVLLEETAQIGGKTYFTGHSKNYIRCAFEVGNLAPNTIVKGKIDKELDDEIVFCEIID